MTAYVKHPGYIKTDVFDRCKQWINQQKTYKNSVFLDFFPINKLYVANKKREV